MSGDAGRARFADRLVAAGNPVRGERPLRTTLRTAHIAAFAALYGGHVFGVAPERIDGALVAAVGTGAGLMALEVYRAPIWLVQVRGAATLAKIALVAASGLLPDWRVALLTLVIVIGSVVSHMPGRYRYFSLLHGRKVAEGAKG